MWDSKGADVCDFCGQRKVIRREEELVFHQWTSRGYVLCRVRIPMGICAECGAKNWDEAAEAVIEEAVRHQYDKLL
jgi:hypothetical protein